MVIRSVAFIFFTRVGMKNNAAFFLPAVRHCWCTIARSGTMRMCNASAGEAGPRSRRRSTNIHTENKGEMRGESQDDKYHHININHILAENAAWLKEPTLQCKLVLRLLSTCQDRSWLADGTSIARQCDRHSCEEFRNIEEDHQVHTY